MRVPSAPPAASGHLLKHLTLIVVSLVLLVAVAVGAMAVGRAMLSPSTVIDVLWQSATGDGRTPLISRNIVLNIRLPRVIAAAVIGAALAVSGTTYQGLFRNPMVSPDILGASTGASFGAALALLFSLGHLPVQAAAFGGGLAAVFITCAAARSIGRGTSQVLLLVLCGMIVSAPPPGSLPRPQDRGEGEDLLQDLSQLRPDRRRGEAHHGGQGSPVATPASSPTALTLSETARGPDPTGFGAAYCTLFRPTAAPGRP